MSRWTQADVDKVNARRARLRQSPPATGLDDGPYLPGEAPRSKHRNVRTRVDGILFDSKWEAQHYHELKLRQAAGDISNLQVHVAFPLVTVDERATPPIYPVVSEYEADFVYIEAGARVVEDTKGSRKLTEMYRLKRKWLELQEGIVIREVYS